MNNLAIAPLNAVRLTPLIEMTQGRPGIAIGLIDGPVSLAHPDLASHSIEEIPGKLRGTCARAGSAACQHGTFVAGILCGRRGSAAPAICPGCTLLVRPIYTETDPGSGDMPGAAPGAVADAIVDCADAGARVLNLSSGLMRPSPRDSHVIGQALDYAALRNVIVVAAAGNQGLIGNSVITRHPAVIPVAACDLRGRPLTESNLGRTIGSRGLMAPGDGITSLGAGGGMQASGGTSAAAPFVTGAIGLLWSEFPHATSPQIRLAVLQAWSARRRAIAPPVLDAWAAYQTLRSIAA